MPECPVPPSAVAPPATVSGKPPRPERTSYLPVRANLPKLILPVKAEEAIDGTTVFKPGVGKEADSVKSEALHAVPLFDLGEWLFAIA